MDAERHWTELLKAMAHPIRLRILQRLMEDEACVKDIWSCLDLPQAVVSQHLSVLRSRGIVGCQREGNMVRYFIQDPRVREILEVLKGKGDG